MKKDSTRFFTAIFVVLLMIAIVDFAVGFVFDKVMEMLPNYSGELAKDNYRLRSLSGHAIYPLDHIRSLPNFTSIDQLSPSKTSRFV